MPRFLVRMALVVALVAVLVTACNNSGEADGEPAAGYPVGLRQSEFVDGSAEEGERHLAVNVFYPAEAPGPGAEPFAMPFYTGLRFYLDLPPAPGRHPLVLLSHGRGGNGLQYAWFAQALAARGYVVAALDHYRANTYDSSVIYQSNKIWRRPLDLSLMVNFLLGEPFWAALLDPDRIGVAGHSQGGFTSLWLAGAKVNAEKFVAFQQGWKNNMRVPAHLRDQMPVDAAPALNVADPRIKAAFAMAPGLIQVFGMDEDGLRQVKVPTYLIVGAGDTQTPPKENAEFAAANIAGSELNVIPGDVEHEIFINECDAEGRDEFPGSCIDAPGVDRAAIHRDVVAAAVKFFDAALGG